MPTHKPIIITSRKATEDLNKIRIQHSDILQGIQNQTERVKNYNMEQENNRKIQDKEDKEFAIKNEDQRMQLDNQRLSEENKAKELSIKEKSLSTEI